MSTRMSTGAKTACLTMALALGPLLSGCQGGQTPRAAASKAPSVSARQAEEARKAAVQMLLALKARDVSRVKSLLHSKSGQYFLLTQKGRANVDANAAVYGLDSMQQDDVERAVTVVPEASRDLLEDMIRFGLNAKWIDRWSPRVVRLAAVKLRLPECSMQAGRTGETLIAPMVEEDGRWKMDGFPTFRVGILKYKRVIDAIKAHDETAI